MGLGFRFKISETMKMIANKHIKLIIALIVSVLIGVWLDFQFGRRIKPTAEERPALSNPATTVIEKVQETSVSSNAAPTMVVDTLTAVKLASVAMVPPPVREEVVDATAKPKTLPRGEDYETMLGQVSALSENLSEKQIGDLYGFLKTPLQNFKGMEAPVVASLKNQVMEKLLEQQTLPPDYGTEMIGLYRNRSNDMLLRNFAVQHLDRYAGALEIRGGYDATSSDAAKIRSAMDAASRETESSIGGTALLGMERLSKLDSKIDRAAIASRAATCAANASTHLQTRIAAVQLCGTMQIKSSANTLRSLANDPAANTVLRLSAKHSLSLLSE